MFNQRPDHFEKRKEQDIQLIFKKKRKRKLHSNEIQIQCCSTIWVEYKMVHYISRLERQSLVWKIEGNFKWNIFKYLVELLEILQSSIYSKEIPHYIYQRISFNINI